MPRDGKRCRPAAEEAPMTRARRISLLLVITLLAIVVHGYHSGTDDGVIYAPGIKKAADPSLYPFDSEFFIHHAQLSLFPQLVAAVTWLTEKGRCESLGERAQRSSDKIGLVNESRVLPRWRRLISAFRKALSEPEWREGCRTLWCPRRQLQNCRSRRALERFAWPVLRKGLGAPCR